MCTKILSKMIMIMIIIHKTLDFHTVYQYNEIRTVQNSEVLHNGLQRSEGKITVK